MKKTVRAAIFALAIVLLVWFAADIPFYLFPDSVYEQTEGSPVFSLHWFSAMMPFTIIVLLSMICIALDLLLRKQLYRKAGMDNARTRIIHRGGRAK